jgi:hypothetical protein
MRISTLGEERGCGGGSFECLEGEELIEEIAAGIRTAHGR